MKNQNKDISNNATNVHLIVFKAGKEEYGIPIEQIREVTITPEISRMPRMPSYIKGVANVRGNIISVMDIEDRFGISGNSQAYERITYTLIIDAKNFTMGILVKEVPQSLSISSEMIDKSPSLLGDLNVAENFINGIAKVDSRLIAILDVAKLLNKEELEKVAAEA